MSHIRQETEGLLESHQLFSPLHPPGRYDPRANNSPKPLEWEWGAEDAFNTIKRQLISLTRLV